MLPTCGLLFLDPTLGPYLSSEYFLSSDQIGLVFGLNSILYITLCPLFSRYITRLKNKRICLLLGCLINGTAFICLGPDSLTQLPQELLYTCIASAIIGFGSIFLYIPVMPELLTLI